MKNQVESLSSPTQSTLLLLWDRPMVLQGSPLTSRSSRKLPFPFPPVTFLHPPTSPHPPTLYKNNLARCKDFWKQLLPNLIPAI